MYAVQIPQATARKGRGRGEWEANRHQLFLRTTCRWRHPPKVARPILGVQDQCFFGGTEACQGQMPGRVLRRWFVRCAERLWGTFQSLAQLEERLPGAEETQLHLSGCRWCIPNCPWRLSRRVRPSPRKKKHVWEMHGPCIQGRPPQSGDPISDEEIRSRSLALSFVSIWGGFEDIGSKDEERCVVSPSSRTSYKNHQVEDLAAATLGAVVVSVSPCRQTKPCPPNLLGHSGEPLPCRQCHSCRQQESRLALGAAVLRALFERPNAARHGQGASSSGFSQFIWQIGREPSCSWSSAFLPQSTWAAGTRKEHPRKSWQRFSHAHGLRRRTGQRIRCDACCCRWKFQLVASLWVFSEAHEALGFCLSIGEGFVAKAFAVFERRSPSQGEHAPDWSNAEWFHANYWMHLGLITAVADKYIQLESIKYRYSF